jgi:hypothetical protein
MAPLSLTATETARKGYARVLRALETPGKAGALAVAMETSDANISRIKNERLEEAIRFMAYLGLKVVEADARCVSPATYEFLTSTHARVLRESPGLIWDEET